MLALQAEAELIRDAPKFLCPDTLNTTVHRA
jgi:hypothetical protein